MKEISRDSMSSLPRPDASMQSLCPWRFLVEGGTEQAQSS